MNYNDFKSQSELFGAGVNNTDILSKHIFVKTWISGGLTGNDCWESLDEEVIDEGPFSWIDELDLFLKSLYSQFSGTCPHKLSELESEIYNNISYTLSNTSDADYYGNYSEHTHLIVETEQLYNKLLELGLFNSANHELDTPSV